MRLDVLICNRRRFLHHVAQITCHREHALALGDGAFHEQNLSAHLGPGQSRHDSHAFVSFLLVVHGAWQSQVFFQMLRLDGGRVVLVQSDFLSGHPGDFRNLLLKGTHAAFVSVVVYYFLKGLRAYLKRALVKSVLFQLLRYEVLLRDFHLLLSQVAAYVYDLHTVQQCRLYRIDAVSCRDEEDVRKVVVQIQIVIVEGAVLLRVESLEKCRRRIALEIGRKLVYLVQHDYRVRSACFLYAVQDTSRQRTDISLSVTSDFGLVVHTAQRDSHIFSVKRFGHRLTQAGLTDSRRAVQAEDRGFHISLKLEHCQVFYDSLLYRIQTIVVAIQNLLCVLQVQIVLTHIVPRKVQHKLQIVILH